MTDDRNAETISGRSAASRAEARGSCGGGAVTPFVPGHNIRGGRKLGSKNRLQKRLLDDLVEAWERDGKDALKVMAKTDPSTFVKTCVGLLPREVLVGSAVSELDDDELEQMLAFVREQLEQQMKLIEHSNDRPIAVEGPNGTARIGAPEAS